jgi:pilus assembly protein Flp/PilA
MLERMKGLLLEEEGQGMAEYGLILAGVAVVCVAIFATLGGSIKTMITNVSNRQ